MVQSEALSMVWIEGSEGTFFRIKVEVSVVQTEGRDRA